MSDTTEFPDRITLALAEKSTAIEKNLYDYSLDKNAIHILFIAYKSNNKLELYAKNICENKYQLIKDYAIVGRSGTLGPKKTEGDKQTPEGFYHINRFNPKSKYFLSLGINYPNDLDQDLNYTGSDIFIHGGTESQGCLAMTDDTIKEIYLYALFAQNSKQEKIPVYIFPFEMTEKKLKEHQIDNKTLAFWQNLQEGFLQFQLTKQELNFSIKNQKYLFQK